MSKLMTYELGCMEMIRTSLSAFASLNPFVHCLWPGVKASDVPDWGSKFPMCILNSVLLTKFKLLLTDDCVVEEFLEK